MIKNTIIMNKPIDTWYEQNDHSIFQLLGNHLQQTRLSQNKTQQEIAALAGINRMTVVQMERGDGGSLNSWVKILRVLGQLELLKIFEIKAGLSPLQLAKLESKKRKRASKKTNNLNTPQTDW